MAKDREDSAEELSESQRLSLLEGAMGTNRTVLVILTLLIIIAVSASITAVVAMALTEEEAPAQLADLEALQQQIDQLQEENERLESRITVLTEELPALKTAIQNSSAPTFQRILIEQESSYQAFLRGLKEGMYDLARMVPGSRTWLDLYNEKMDRALAQSQQRKRKLTNLETGEPLIEP